MVISDEGGTARDPTLSVKSTEVYQLQRRREKLHPQTERPRSLWTMQVSRDSWGNAGKRVIT